jgi:SAM-dependent methyltransferase
MEAIGCPLCGGARHRFVYERRDHTHYVTGTYFRVVRCRDCGMVFVNPRPGPGEIGAYYPDEYYEAQIAPPQLLRDKRAALEARARLLDDLGPGRLLDVGCQKGEFLQWMRERGWEVQGVELSRRAPNLFCLPIFYGRLEQAGFAPRSFDAITAWAVLEHVHDPLALLRAIARLLAPAGRAFVLVPNFRSLPGRFMRHDDVPRHLLMFTPATLARAAAAAGLRIERTVFSDDIFSGSTRGVLNFAVKRAFGESYDDILQQNRSPAQWHRFSETLNGEPSRLMAWVDALDRRCTPALDALMRALRCSFTMTAELAPR